MGIEFEENNLSQNNRFQSRVVLGIPQTPGMVNFLMSKGVIKNEKQAGNLLLVLTGLFFLSAIVIFVVYVWQPSFLQGSPKPSPLQERLQNRVPTPNL